MDSRVRVVLALGLWALCVVLCVAMGGCAAFRQPQPPPEPGAAACTAWRSAESAWVLADAYARQQLAESRAAACVAPPVPDAGVGGAE